MIELEIPCALVDTDSISFNLDKNEILAISIDADTIQRVFVEKNKAKELRDWLNVYLGEENGK